MKTYFVVLFIFILKIILKLFKFKSSQKFNELLYDNKYYSQKDLYFFNTIHTFKHILVCLFLFFYLNDRKLFCRSGCTFN